MLPGFGIFFSGFARSGEGNKIDLILQSPLEFDRPDGRCDSRICLTLLNLIDTLPAQSTLPSIVVVTKSPFVKQFFEPNAEGI